MLLRMPGRYERDFNIDVGPAMKRRPPPKPRHDPLEDIMRLGAGLAPAAGTAIGAGVGSMAGGIGALPGAAIGGAIGTGVGGALGAGADMQSRDADEAARRRAEMEEEEAAQHRMALSMLQGL